MPFGAGRAVNKEGSGNPQVLLSKIIIFSARIDFEWVVKTMLQTKQLIDAERNELMRGLIRPAFFVIATAIFAQPGCGPLRVEKPVDSVRVGAPGSWSAAAGGREERISTGWVAELGDAGLAAAVSEAIASNPGLAAAAARMRAAGQESMVARAARLPKVSAGGSGGWSDRIGESVSGTYGLNLAASWEVDLWGRLRALDEAALADGRAAREDFRGARLSLAANTAKAWCNVVSAGQELELAKLTLDSFEKNLRIIERNYRGTGEGALDLRFGRTNVASARRSLEARKHERDEAARTLQVMLGRYPDGLVASPPELPALKGGVPTGLPAGLLERRPDLAAARARLTASARRADASRVALLPDVALTGAGGMTSARFAEWFDLDGLVVSVAARVSQAMFEGGAAEAQARAARERNAAWVQDYCRLALEAFREVESALAAEGSLQRQEGILGEEVAQAALGERQAERDYAEGVNPNILSVLEAQRRANNARAAMIRLRNQRLLNRINLHLALGGDFRTDEKH